MFNFISNGKNHDNIEDCIDLESTSYMHVSVNDYAKKAVLPNSHFVVCEKNFGIDADEAIINNLRKQLSPIRLKVHYRDIYDNKFIYEREFDWFLRHA